ncbi:hypothetical protein PPL_10864 [Heterostelium album PN500]|uniref:Uncharacterized protein n=1 Tax=Heterostelium pallidum (strain ATCC 26659 / Pp 5 / PN500) TaxID=670386 RepID=D3BS72_HETP5|nr:hypothetical protein PPL_10864 [Heterostelium album PN500]EFA75809.1 hypothetical protein PPL_10864 [Heterostelium album PN500]|eukprot:XP_020427943.1 hypothetical protein PPL_10864 [Heterostelium album PN500]
MKFMQSLKDFAADGLRTLCLAYGVIAEEEYHAWIEQYKEVSIQDYDKKMDRVS